jgi:hypothetical protein
MVKLREKWNQGKTNVPMVSKSGGLFGDSMPNLGQWANPFHTTQTFLKKHA